MIERHARTINASSRADLYTWAIDPNAGTAEIVEKRFRQLRRMDKRLDVRPIAEELRNAIVSSRQNDPRIRWMKDGFGRSA
jgi:hypothetical protein